MVLTKYALEKMGFSEYPESDVLAIQFSIVRVYSIQGLNFNPDSPLTISKVIEFGENCSAVVSNSINDACRTLTGDNFIDEDEEQWIESKKVKPPFVLIYFKEFQSRILKGGRRKEHDGNIITYDAFPEGKADIRKWEKESLPSIVTSLVVHLSTLKRPVFLIPVERAISGKTDTGVTVFDIKMTGSANIVVSFEKTSTELNVSLLKASELFKKLEYKTSQHFFSALNEDDRLKQFLSYFMFIERHTHRQFKALNYEDDASSAFNVPQRLIQSGKLFFEERFNDSHNLAQRFHWCAILTWHQLNDQDISDFLDIKKTRDRLTHGEDILESELPVEKARNLALKLLGTI
jgi:hypothetical protein